ncbi:MAG: amidohydrolase family protein [Alphaproteobacteria bacterium]|nr:amidohydrolase family protein [Alphaproteobacteria bacterium]
MHDLVIRDGLIVDGTGAPARSGDVAVDGGRLAQVGGKAGPGRRELAAGGRLITPGFIDVHTHYDGQATWDPMLAPSSWHGVTTIVMGNCGVGFAPVRPDKHEWLINVMEGVEDIPGTALSEGIPWGWEGFPQYLDALDRAPHAIDIGAQLPHGALRAYVMGERGAANEPASEADIARMSALLEEALLAGALGFTSTRTVLHRTKDGAHVPGYQVAVDELRRIVEPMKRLDKGAIGINSDFVDVAGELAWMRRLQRATGRPVWFLLVQFNDDPQKWRRILAGCEAASAAGEPLLAQVAGRPIGFLLGLESSLHPFMSRPSYKAIARLPLPERVARLREPAMRQAILAERVSHKSDVMRTVTERFDRMFRLGDPPDYEPPPEASVAAIAEREGRAPAEIAYDMLLEREGRELLFMPAFNYAGGDHAVIAEMMAHPNTLLGLSDGGAHCGLICDASTPTFMLTHWARDRRRGPKLALEEAVRQQTSGTAALYGLGDRGVLAPGKKADLNLIDLAGLILRAPEMVRDLPAGGRRLVQRAEGYAATVVAGEVTFENGQATGALPGRLVRGARSA